MPDVRTYRAATMREALERVRIELGGDAVILATRQVPVRRLVPWGHREEVEITAGLGIATRTIVAHRTARADQGADTRGADAPRSPRPHISSMPHLTQQERRAAEIVKELQRRHIDVPITQDPPLARGGLQGAVQVAAPATDLSMRFDAIERLLVELGRRQTAAADVPPEVLAAYERLVAGQVDEPLARELAERLKDQAGSALLADPAAAEMLLGKLVESELRCCGPIGVEPGVRKVIALVGPTGVGKTTTLVKLAAGFRLKDGLTVGVVCTDTERIAAADQLRTYAEIIGLPMKAVSTSAEIDAAIDEFRDLDVVLIDTAGRSPRNAERIAELGELLAAANSDETHLVLSLCAGRRTLAGQVNRFRALSPTSVIVTKLDEADGAGPLVALCRDGGLPISYLTTGQDVPDDIEPAQAERIARSIVGALPSVAAQRDQHR